MPHSHDKHHWHTHHHSAPALENINTAFYIGIGLNAAFTLIEFIVGYTTHSLALIADASHNLSDVASLIISLIWMKLAQRAATKLYTYGYKKASIMASLVNAILLIVIVIGIIRESIERWFVSPEIAGGVIILTALIGVLINTISAFAFYKGQKHDINIKWAFLHLLVDALVSVWVVISGILIYYTHWNIIDTLISLVIAVVILVSTWWLLRESLKLALDGVPQNINLENIKHIFDTHENILSFHHLHVWALSSRENALTVHIVGKDHCSVDDMIRTKNDLKQALTHENISHATIEFEKQSEYCEEKQYCYSTT